MEERHVRRNSHVHNAFGLSYASFLILPRTYLSDMPTKWQKQFVKLLDEYNDAVGDNDPSFSYEMYVQFKENRKFCKIPTGYCNYRHPEHKDLLIENNS